jgi:hypothetical protein
LLQAVVAVVVMAVVVLAVYCLALQQHFLLAQHIQSLLEQAALVAF